MNQSLPGASAFGGAVSGRHGPPAPDSSRWVQASNRSRCREFPRASAVRAALGAVVLCLAGCAQQGPPPSLLPDSSPSLILITIDTLRADHVSSYGYKRPTTPYIDELSKLSVLFEEALSLIPTTGPSHASMLTGKEPSRLGLRDNGQRLDSAETTLAEILRDAGYRTAAVVASTPLREEAAGLESGFEVYDDEFEGEERDAKEVTDLAIEWLDGVYAGGEPLFLWVHYYDPHAKYELHEEHLPALRKTGRYRDHHIRNYDTEIRKTDRAIGRLISRLDKLNLLDPSALIVTADHGETLAEHDGRHYNHTDIYETCLRVPFILKLPHQKRGRRVLMGSIVRLVDIFPTFLDLANIDPPPSDGCSLLALAEGDMSSEWTCGETTFVEKHMKVGVHVKEGEVSSLWGVRASPWKFILDNLGGKQLYNLSADRDETRNLAGGAEADIEKEMELRLKQWIREGIYRSNRSGDDMPPEVRKQLQALGYL